MNSSTFLTLLLASTLVASTFAVSCKSDNWCKGCHASTADQCTSCFDGGADEGARYMVGTVCSGTVTAITNCKHYISSLTTAAAATAGGSTGGCLVCNSGYYTVITQNPANTYTTTCASALPTGCTAITNCASTYCSVDTPGNTQTAGCRYCSSGAATAANTCNTTHAITNCTYEYWHPTNTQNECWQAASGYSVSNTATTTTAYTTDSNCHSLQAGNTTCRECTFGYYWDSTSCKQAAGLISAAFAALAVLFA